MNRVTHFRIALVTLALALTAADSHAQGKGIPPGAKKISSKTMPGSQKEKSFPELVKVRDANALDALGYLRCMTSSLAAAKTGRLGAFPVNELAVCVKEGAEWRAVFGQLDESKKGFTIRMQVVAPIATITTKSIDTASVAAIARAMIRAAAMPLPSDKSHLFAPVVLRNDVSYDIWFLPTQSNPSNSIVGGDSLVQLNRVGERELGHTIDAPPTHVWSVAPGPLVTLDSPEDGIPAVSEFMVANLALSVGDTVRVRTQRWEFTQTRAKRGGWVVTPRIR